MSIWELSGIFVKEILDRPETNLIVITETAQIKLLQSIVENLLLNYFQKIIHKPGFAQTLLAIVRELEAGMIEPDSFQDAVTGNRPGWTIKGTGSDLSRIP